MKAKGIKAQNAQRYKGAKWLQISLRGETNNPDYEMSLFAIKVANILGQVFNGVDKISYAALSQQNRRLWRQEKEIKVSIFGDMSSYGASTLMVLFLCCHKANVNLSISGSRKNYIRLIFKDQIPDDIKQQIPIIDPDHKQLIDPDLTWETLLKKMTGLNTESTTVQDCSNILSIQTKNDLINLVSFKYKTLNHIELYQLLKHAYTACVAIELKGVSHNKTGLLITVYRIEKTANQAYIFPDFNHALELFAPLYSFDFATI